MQLQQSGPGGNKGEILVLRKNFPKPTAQPDLGIFQLGNAPWRQSGVRLLKTLSGFTKQGGGKASQFGLRIETFVSGAFQSGTRIHIDHFCG
jgi:hypothetical protein